MLVPLQGVGDCCSFFLECSSPQIFLFNIQGLNVHDLNLNGTSLEKPFQTHPYPPAILCLTPSFIFFTRFPQPKINLFVCFFFFYWPSLPARIQAQGEQKPRLLFTAVPSAPITGPGTQYVPNKCESGEGMNVGTLGTSHLSSTPGT